MKYIPRKLRPCYGLKSDEENGLYHVAVGKGIQGGFTIYDAQKIVIRINQIKNPAMRKFIAENIVQKEEEISK